MKGKKKVKEFAHLAKKIKLDVVYDIILDNPLAMYEEKEELEKLGRKIEEGDKARKDLPEGQLRSHLSR